MRVRSCARKAVRQPQSWDLDRRAAVHHDLDAGGFGARRRSIVAHAELHPDDFGALHDRLVDDPARGLKVVMNRCPAIEIPRLGLPPR